MFERVIAQTIQKIGAEALRDRSLIPLSEILEDDRIPYRFKPFFETEVRWWLYNEALARAANKRFDYEHPEPASLLSYLEQVQFRHARFEREDFLTVLDSAVKLTYNFICRPQTTLKWYIFRGEPVKPLREVMLRFGAFADYDYFRTVFAEWVDRKQSERLTFDAISSTEFERVIRRIDDQILLSCTVEDLLALMDPFFDFIGGPDDYRVPVDALVIFFDDKNIKKLVDYLEEYRAHGRETVGREEFLALLDELLTSAEDEPEADFSTVYQNDELDDVVRQHLHSDDDAAADGDASIGGQSPMPQTGGNTIPYSSWNATVDRNAPREAAEAPLVVESEEHGDGPLPTDLSAEEIEKHIGFISDVRSSVAFGLSAFERAGGSAEAVGHEPATDASTGLESSADAVADASDVEPVAEMRTRAEDVADASPSPSPAAVPDGSRPDSASSTVNVDEAVDDDDDDDDDETGELMELSRTLAASPRRIDEYAEEAAPPVISEPGDDSSAKEDVRRYIDAMLERKVVKKIFQRNRGEYEAALDRINTADSWRVASQILDEIFIRYDVDPYSRTAIRFTDSIYGRYLPKQR